MATNSVIVVLVGLPASGKTTFSKSCKTFFSLHSQEFAVTIFHYDELCKTFSADERKSVLCQVEEFVLKSKSNKDVINIIIIDDNNYYKSMRFEYLKLCRKLNLGFLIVYFKMATIENALARNKIRNVNEQVPNDIIKDMFKKLEEPVGEFVISIDVDYYNYDFELFKKRIFEASNNPMLQPEQTISIKMPQSVLQQIDLVLRRIVHRKILEDKSRAREFNVLKRELYQKICVCREDDFDGLEDELGKYFV